MLQRIFTQTIKSQISNYTVHLPKSINLIGQHEVAIAEVFYTNSWFNVEENNDYSFYYRHGKIINNAKLPSGFYSHPKYLVTEIMTLLRKLYGAVTEIVKTRKEDPIPNPPPFNIPRLTSSKRLKS